MLLSGCTTLGSSEGFEALGLCGPCSQTGTCTLHLNSKQNLGHWLKAIDL